MNRIPLPISEIIVENRQRQDLGDIVSLAESIRQYGLIQPIVIDQNKRLLAGGRRLAAHQHLGLSHVDVVYKETLSEDEKYLIELEENVRRKDFTWQERCLNIATIHQIKKRNAALDSKAWGQRHTAEALGLDGHASVNYAIRIAERLAVKSDPLWQCESMMDAWRTLMREEIDRVNAELARRQTEASSITVTEEIPDLSLFTEVDSRDATAATDATGIAPFADVPYECLSKEQALARYLGNPLNPPDKFEEYYAFKMRQIEERNTVRLSNILHHGDSIKYMRANLGRFDHVITDIPYGIDMEMLNQQNPHGGMNDIDTVEAEHTVEGNVQLFHDFFPAAFATLKDNGFCITWCDIMQWQLMYDLAIKAGFKVQRWPITWDKTHSCMNQTAQFNFTKSTEIAIVCRKGRATLITPQAKCVVAASRDELCDALGHPFAKPFEVWRFLTEAVSIEGQTILEPFAGRGSGVISMLRLKRNVVGVELNQNHYNALLENVKTQHFLQLNPNSIFK